MSPALPGVSDSVAIDGDTAIVGAPGASLGGTTDAWNYGAAYVFARTTTGSPWSETTRLDEYDASALSNFAGFGSQMDVSGDRVVVGIYWNGLPESVDFPAGARVYEHDHPAPGQWGMCG